MNESVPFEARIVLFCDEPCNLGGIASLDQMMGANEAQRTRSWRVNIGHVSRIMETHETGRRVLGSTRILQEGAENRIGSLHCSYVKIRVRQTEGTNVWGFRHNLAQSIL